MFRLTSSITSSLAGNRGADRDLSLRLRQGDTAEGLAALYAYESQIPAVSESKINGLKKHYGFTDPESYRYFTVHIEADREHAAAERALLAENVQPENSAAVTETADRVLAASGNCSPASAAATPCSRFAPRSVRRKTASFKALPAGPGAVVSAVERVSARSSFSATFLL